MKKQVFIARYRHGLKGPTRVFASTEAEARAEAFAAYTFTSTMHHPNYRIDEVVESVELAGDQTMGGYGILQSVQIPCSAPGSDLAAKENYGEEA